jgi:hypothetical protein
VALRNEPENSASSAGKEQHGITAVSVSCGTMTRTKAYITAMIVAYVEKAVALGKTFFIARFAYSHINCAIFS